MNTATIATPTQTSILDLPVQVGVSTHLINKREPLKKRWNANGFRGQRMSIRNWLYRVVKMGYASLLGNFAGGNTRERSFLEGQALALDIDDGMLLGEMLAHPFYQKYGLAIYTSCNHQKEKATKGGATLPAVDRYRVIFMSPVPIAGEKAKLLKALIEAVAEQFPACDRSALNINRVWRGNSKAEIYLNENAQFLGGEVIERQKQIFIELNSREEAIRVRQEIAVNWDDAETSDKKLIELLQDCPSRDPGSGTYIETWSCAVAFYNAMADKDLAEQALLDWSPPCEGWNPIQKAHDSKYRGSHGIGTLYYFAKQNNPEKWRSKKRRIDDIGSLIFGTKWAIKKQKRLRNLEAKRERDGVVYFEAGQGNAIINRVLRGDEKYQKIKVIINTSGTGTGKTHNAAELKPANREKLIYLSNNHRNVTVEELETKFYDLPTRHNGLEVDRTRQTPTGDPYRIRPTGKEGAELTHGNCKYSAGHIAAAAHGFLQTGKELCKLCEFRSLCTKTSGDGYGFRHERHEALSTGIGRLRAHSASLPPVDQWDYANTVLLIDEWQSFETIRTYRASISDFLLQSIASLTDYPLLLEKYVDIFQKNLSSYGDNFGIGHQELEDLLLGDGGFSSDSVHQMLMDARPLQAEIAPGEESAKALEDILKDSKPPVAALFAHVLFGGGLGSCRVIRNHADPSQSMVEVKMVDERLLEVQSEAKLTVIFDATSDKREIAAAFNLDDDQILEIQQRVPDITNTTIQLVELSGLGSYQNWSDDALTRIEKTLFSLRVLHPDLAVFGPKSHKERLKLDGCTFADTVGENRFQDRSAIALVGTPYTNVGESKAYWRALTGSFDGFSEWFAGKVDGSVIQALGRLRSVRRSSEKLTFYWITANPKPEIFANLGCEVRSQHAGFICPEAATGLEKVRYLLSAFAGKYAGTDEFLNLDKIRQGDFAAAMGVSRTQLSHALSELNLSWKAFAAGLKQIAKNVWKPIKDSIRDSHISQRQATKPVDDAITQWLQGILQLPPVAVIYEVAQILSQGMSWEEFMSLLLKASPDVSWQLMAAIAPTIPEARQHFDPPDE